MATIDTDTYRSRLIQERKRVEQALGQGPNNGSSEDQTDEGTFDNHVGDAAAATLDRVIDHSLEENSENMLAAIDEALGRIEEGTFGTCARCEKTIAAERLEAMPYATKCIDCKRLEERG